MNYINPYFERLARRIRQRTRSSISRFVKYIRRLLFPLYMFPIKIITYTAYYITRFVIKFIFALISLVFEMVLYPFLSLKNFLKAGFFVLVFAYLFASLFVITDYLGKEYGYIGKFLCSYGAENELQKKVVRVVGGYSEGSGFFIDKDRVLTNFHVIADEPSPKIIFPDGQFITPKAIIGDSDADLAVLIVEGEYSDLVLEFLDPFILYKNEKLIAAGYPLGTEITGNATVIEGNYFDVRFSKYYPVSYIHTDIDLVGGMSGGPLIERCGKVVGVSTMGISGQSLFISSFDVLAKLPDFSDANIEKIEADPSISPEAAVEAFYTYLKARKMEEGFALLSENYLLKTDFEEWTARFMDVLDVEVYYTERFEDSADTVFIKFSTKTWDGMDVDYHYYEGTWETVLEDDIYKMNESNIKEVYKPDWSWFYTS